MFGRGFYIRIRLQGAFVSMSPEWGGRSFGSALGCGRWRMSGCALDVDQDVAAMERNARRLRADPGAHELHLGALPLHLLQRRRADGSTPVADMASGVFLLKIVAGTRCWPGCGGCICMNSVKRDLPGRGSCAVVTPRSHLRILRTRASHVSSYGRLNASVGQVGPWRGTLDGTSIRRTRRRQNAQ